MALKLDLIAELAGVYRGANDISTPEQKFATKERIALATGTTAGKADLVFSDTRTLAASASENLDLAGGLSDAFGAALTFAEVVAILVRASEANTNDVVIGGAASNAFSAPFGAATDKLVIKPGGYVLLVAPGDPAYPVTAGTGDLLKVANSAGSTGVTYDIIIVGRSA